MSTECLDELLLCRFLDDESIPRERKRVEVHLESCTRCRELVRRRLAENRQIREMFTTTHTAHTPDLVPAVMEKLGTPGLSASHQREQRHRHHQRSRFINRSNYRWVLATAASILLAGFLFVFLFLITPTKSQTSEKQVILCSATVDGQEVRSHIYESAESGIQFIWLEIEK